MTRIVKLEFRVFAHFFSGFGRQFLANSRWLTLNLFDLHFKCINVISGMQVQVLLLPC